MTFFDYEQHEEQSQTKLLIEELNRKVTQEEYDKVLEDFDEAGLYNGWLQEL